MKNNEITKLFNTQIINYDESKGIVQGMYEKDWIDQITMNVNYLKEKYTPLSYFVDKKRGNQNYYPHTIYITHREWIACSRIKVCVIKDENLKGIKENIEEEKNGIIIPYNVVEYILSDCKKNEFATFRSFKDYSICLFKNKKDENIIVTWENICNFPKYKNVYPIWEKTPEHVIIYVQDFLEKLNKLQEDKNVYKVRWTGTELSNGIFSVEIESNISSSILFDINEMKNILKRYKNYDEITVTLSENMFQPVLIRSHALEEGYVLFMLMK